MKTMLYLHIFSLAFSSILFYFTESLWGIFLINSALFINEMLKKRDFLFILIYSISILSVYLSKIKFLFISSILTLVFLIIWVILNEKEIGERI